MAIFLIHFLKSLGGQIRTMSSYLFSEFIFQTTSQKVLICGIFLVFVSCQKEEEPDLLPSGSFKLTAINRSICPGMKLQLRLYDDASGKELDFSEFTFAKLPNDMGEISADGLYQAPDLILANSTLELRVSWNRNPRIIASHFLELKTNSDPNLITKVPHQVELKFNFYGLSESNDFLFGSPPIGTGPAKSERYIVSVVGVDGQYKWEYDIGIGSTQFGLIYNNYFIVSGGVLGMDGIYKIASKIYDPNGNDRRKEIQEKILFRNYYVNQSNELFLSNTKHPFYSNQTQVFKLSSDFEILQQISISHPIHSFIVDDTGSVVGYYVDELNKKSGVIKVCSDGKEEWNVSLPFGYPFDAKLVQINNQKFGLIKAECKTIPCLLEMAFYEFGVNGEIINPGKTIARSIGLNELISTQIDDFDKYYIDSNYDMIKDILVSGDEVLFVFYASTKNYSGILIKGTKGSSLEHWWDTKFEKQSSMTHVKLSKKEGRLEWKTLCGNAICTFKLDEKLTFNSCF